ncbi:MAG: hypothetical protein IPF54_20295 [Draconibacterium sp.]|nr:hypothetical protein [Draconibacterium sp.]
MANQLTTQELSYHQKVSGNAFATATIIPGLTVTGTFSGDLSVDNSKTVSYPYKLADKKDRSTTDISLSFSKGISMLANVYANYNKEFGNTILTPLPDTKQVNMREITFRETVKMQGSD